MLKNIFKPTKQKVYLSILTFILLISLYFLTKVLEAGLVTNFPVFLINPIQIFWVPALILYLPIIGLTFSYLGDSNLDILIGLLFIFIYHYFIFNILFTFFQYLNKFKLFKITIVLLIITFIAWICINVYPLIAPQFFQSFQKTADDSQASTQGVQQVVDGNNQFTIKLFNNISKDSNKNVFLSPWSISNAMAITFEGASGNTASEIQNVLNFPTDYNILRSSYAKLINDNNKNGGNFTLKTANAIWINNKSNVLTEYKNTVDKYYLASSKSLDFANNSVTSANEINSWVRKNTNNKIDKLVSPDNVNNSTEIIITNAVYFYADWLDKFDKKDTKNQDFQLIGDQTISIPFMSLTKNFNYAEDENTQVLEMDYKGKKVSMLVLLPKENSTQNLESSLTIDQITKWKNNITKEKVLVQMPKFKFETEYQLIKNLQELGITSPFIAGKADFSKLSSSKGLYINTINHKAYVDVSEKGTEAAAATSGGVMIMSLPRVVEPIKFIVDHPFIFIISEKETGNILFIGKVINPLLNN